MKPEEKKALETEWKQLQEKLKGDFVNPKDMRRCEEITSLLMTNGESKEIKFKFLKARNSTKGLNAKKDRFLKY